MSLVMLPVEVLETILEFLNEHSLSKEHQINQSISSPQHDLAMLCLVSKQFLLLARSHLYRRPFSASLTADWFTASGLLASLVKQGGALGKMVRSIYGIITYAIRLHRLNAILRHRDWYIGIIAACPNLVEIDIATHTLDELEGVVDALPKSGSKLSVVNFAKFGTGGHPFACSDHVTRKVLRHPALRNIEHVSLHRLEPDLKDSTPLITQHIISLSIDDNYRDNSGARQLMPLDCSTLVKFELTTRIRYSHIVTYLALLPSTIQDISLRISNDCDIKTLLDYTSRPSGDTKIPLDGLSSFPDLLSFRLYQFPTLTPSLLSTLLTSSPLLTSISFRRSTWILEKPHSNQVPWTHHCEDVFPLSEIIIKLKRFKFLRRIHLGHVPALEQTLIELEEVKENVKFLLEWDSHSPVQMNTE